MNAKDRPYKVYRIDEGVVIDHIPAKKALEVINVLGAMEGDSIVTMGANLDSKKMGRKDVVKVEKKELSMEELMKIALIAPNATINIIRKDAPNDKIKIKVPAVFNNIIKCSNPNCITQHQPVKSRFHTVSEAPLRIRCHFCERVFDRDEVELI